MKKDVLWTDRSISKIHNRSTLDLNHYHTNEFALERKCFNKFFNKCFKDVKLKNAVIRMPKLNCITDFVSPFKQVFKDATGNRRSICRCYICGKMIRTDKVRIHMRQKHCHFIKSHEENTDKASSATRKSKLKLASKGSSKLASKASSKLASKGSSSSINSQTSKNSYDFESYERIKEFTKKLKQKMQDDGIWDLSTALLQLENDQSETNKNLAFEIEKEIKNFKVPKKGGEIKLLFQCSECYMKLCSVANLNHHFEKYHKVKLLKHIELKERQLSER